jgi:hypothetical protein
VGTVNYPGDLSVAVVFKFKGEAVSGALRSAPDFPYLVANELVTKFEVRGVIGGATYKIARRTGKDLPRLFDDGLNTFLSGPVSGTDLDTLLAGSATYHVDLTFAYATFFDELLQEMTADASSSHNAAKPVDSAKMLGTFVRSADKGKVSITYKYATEALKNIPATLIDKEVKAASAPGKPPAVKLVFLLDFKTGIDDTKRAMMRKLIAMDWTKLAKLGKPVDPPATLPVAVSVWNNNLRVFLANQTSLARGRAIRDQIKNANKSKTALQLSSDLRNDIDQWIVTANHWGEARESLQTERHQRLLSDVFGTIHQSAWLGSPVSHLRGLGRTLNLSLEDRVALTLTWGAGHCGEHAAVSFWMLAKIIDETSAKEVSHVVLTGNANIDHAFVVYNLDVKDTIRTLTTAANNSRVDKVGDEIVVWNLRETIKANSPKQGYVMDPYLDPTVMKPKAEDLLAALNNAKRKAANKHTDFMAFNSEHPSSVTETNIKADPVATRRSKVPNV